MVNEAAWIAKESNPFEISGASCAYSDGVSVSSPSHTENPWDWTEQAFCIAGTTTADGSSERWGGGIYIALSGIADEDPFGYTSSGFDWRNAFVTGFKLGLGLRLDSAGVSPEVRVSFPTQPRYDPASGQLAPYIVSKGTGTYDIESAQVPAKSSATNPGERVDGRPIYAVDIQVVGGDARTAGPYKLCVEEFMPVWQ